MSKTVTFFNDNLDPEFAGHTFNLIPVRWDYDEVRDKMAFVETSEEDAECWAIYHPFDGELSPFLNGEPTDYGKVSQVGRSVELVEVDVYTGKMFNHRFDVYEMYEGVRVAWVFAMLENLDGWWHVISPDYLEEVA